VNGLELALIAEIRNPEPGGLGGGGAGTWTVTLTPVIDSMVPSSNPDCSEPTDPVTVASPPVALMAVTTFPDTVAINSCDDCQEMVVLPIGLGDVLE